jgi:hypothetical protein
MNGAPLDEVYGNDFIKKNKKKLKKNKKQKYYNYRDDQSEQACDYYAKNYAMNLEQAREQKEKLAFNIDSNDYINYFAEYDNVNSNLSSTKKMLQKDNFSQQSNHNNELEDYFDKLYGTNEFQNIEDNNSRNFMDDYNDDDGLLSDYEQPPNNNRKRPYSYSKDDIKKFQDYKQKYSQFKYDNNISNKNDNTYYEKDKYYMDFGLYLISGILLIFILEQFVQVGLLIKERKDNELLLKKIIAKNDL